MKNTTNYGFKKPEGTEFYDINTFNDNMDSIDALLKKLEMGGAVTKIVGASEYSTETSYVVGDYCIKNAVLHKCIAETSGEFNTACWGVTSILNEITGTGIMKIVGYDRENSTNITSYVGEENSFTVPSDGVISITAKYSPSATTIVIVYVCESDSETWYRLGSVFSIPDANTFDDERFEVFKGQKIRIVESEEGYLSSAVFTPYLYELDKETGGSSLVTYEVVASALNAYLEQNPIESGSVSDEQVANAVEEYLTENPVQSGATTEQVAQIEKNTADISTLSQEIVEQQTQINSQQEQINERATTEYVDAEISDLKAQGVQQVPLFANSVDECTDKTKVYVLPDGYIYGYGEKTEEKEVTTTIPAKAAVIVGKRYSLSSAAFVDYTSGSVIVIPIDSTDSAITVTLENLSMSAYNYVYTGVTASAFTVEVGVDWTSDNLSFTCKDTAIQAINYNGYSFFAICVTSTGEDGQYDNSKLYYNGEEVELVITDDPTIASLPTTSTTTETVTTEGFFNTGRAFVPADYENRIIALEGRTFSIVDSVDEMTDKNSVYVLDKHIYMYGTTVVEEVEIPGETVANFTNIKDQCYFKHNYRYSYSGGGYSAASGMTTIIVPVPSDSTSLTIYVQGATNSSSLTAMYAGTGTDDFTVTDTVYADAWPSTCLVSAGLYKIPVTKSVGTTGVLFHLDGSSESDFTDVIVTVDEPIEYVPKTELIEADKFYDTGLAFLPTDYEDKISELENVINNVKMQFEPADYINSVHCPTQLPANGETGTDFNLHTFTDFGAEFHAYFDDLLEKYPHYLIREYLGKDTSETYDMYRYVLGKHYWSAWYKENYPRMYAWKNDSTIIYSVSVSPRIDDTMYSTSYIGTAYATVTAVSATNRSRTVNDLEFVRYEDGDIEPTVRYTPSYNPSSKLVNTSGNTVATVSSIDDNVLTASDGNTYIRYPFGDLKKDKTKPIHMTIITNEHGGDSEPAIPTLVAARLIRDLCNGQCSSDNPIYRYLRDNVQITVIPPVNPYGLHVYATGDRGENNNYVNGYHNVNNVNINRNYDTPGWDYCYENKDTDNNAYLGSYPGSENETQYVMNTMVDSKAVIAMSVHTISCLATGIIYRCNYQGQNPNGEYTQSKLDDMADDMKSSYNLDFFAYNPLECPPETTSKSPSFITQCGAYGGIVEFQCHNPLATEEEATAQTTMFTDVVMEQNYSLLLKFIAMWLSDYLENN